MRRALAVVVALVVVVACALYFTFGRAPEMAPARSAIDAGAPDAGTDAFVATDAPAIELIAPTPPPTTTGIVFVRSRPIESEVWIDGEHVGTTPQQVSLEVGTHRLELRTSYMGGSSWHRTLHVSAERAERVDYFWPLPTPDHP